MKLLSKILLISVLSPAVYPLYASDSKREPSKIVTIDVVNQTKKAFEIYPEHMVTEKEGNIYPVSKEPTSTVTFPDPYPNKAEKRFTLKAQKGAMTSGGVPTQCQGVLEPGKSFKLTAKPGGIIASPKCTVEPQS
jgi:hypothetical protein